MAQSIRISDEVCTLASQESRQMNRSLAQQIEHWVKLGVALELSGATTLDDVRSLSAKFRSAALEDEVRSGRRSAASLHAIPASVARQAKAEFPRGAFKSGRKSW